MVHTQQSSLGLKNTNNQSFHSDTYNIFLQPFLLTSEA